MKIFSLLPVYNEEGNLRDLIGALHRSVATLNLEHRIIVFNDGSTDASGAILEELAAQYPVTVIGDGLNHGLGAGFVALLKKACELSESADDVAIVMDADNTHNPTLIRKSLKTIIFLKLHFKSPLVIYTGI